MRLSEGQEWQNRFKKGFRGLLTPGGLYAKSRILNGVTNQLIFEKELADSVIFSDVQGIILFGPDRAFVLANRLAGTLCKANSIAFATIDAFRP